MKILKCVGRILAIGGLGLSLCIGTLSFIASTACMITYYNVKNKTISEFKQTQEYQDLREEALEEIHKVREKIEDVEEQYEEGKLLKDEYEFQINTYEKEIDKMEDNFDYKLVRKSQNEEIMHKNETMDNLEIASATLLGVTALSGVTKTIILIANDESSSFMIRNEINNQICDLQDDLEK